MTWSKSATFSSSSRLRSSYQQGKEQFSGSAALYFFDGFFKRFIGYHRNGGTRCDIIIQFSDNRCGSLIQPRISPFSGTAAARAPLVRSQVA